MNSRKWIIIVAGQQSSSQPDEEQVSIQHLKTGDVESRIYWRGNKALER